MKQNLFENLKAVISYCLPVYSKETMRTNGHVYKQHNSNITIKYEIYIIFKLKKCLTPTTDDDLMQKMFSIHSSSQNNQ